MNVRSELMTYDELHARGKQGIPHTFVLEHDGASLYYFGTKHLFEYEGNQEIIEDLESFWNKFVQSMEDSQVMFTEGSSKDSVPSKEFENQKEAVEHSGEVGLVTMLARNADVNVKSPEPKPKKYTKLLAEVFSKKQVVYYLVMRSLAYAHKQKRDTIRDNPDDFLQAQLDRWKAATEWKDIDWSLQMLKQIHRGNFGGELDPQDTQFFDVIRRPGWKTTITNKVAHESSRIRDEVITKRIVETVKDGTNVFVVFGVSHAHIQEPALRNILTS